MSIAEDFKKLSTPQKIAIVGGGGLALFFLGRAAYDQFSGNSSSASSTTTSPAAVDTTGSGDTSSGDTTDMSSAISQLAQNDQTFQTSLTQALANSQQQDQAFQQSITQALAQSQQSTQQQLAAQNQQFQQALTSIVQGQNQSATQSQYQQPISGLQNSQQSVQTSIASLLGKQQQPSNVSLPAYSQPSAAWNEVARGSVDTAVRSTTQSTAATPARPVVDNTPQGKTVSGSNYKQVVNQAGGLWQNNKWVAGSYQGNKFVPKK